LTVQTPNLLRIDLGYWEDLAKLVQERLFKDFLKVTLPYAFA
jgi:hypothetical protein